MKLSDHLEEKGINLVGLPVTLAHADESLVSTKHSGFVRRMEENAEEYLLNIDMPLAIVPQWLLEIENLTLAIHFADERKTWTSQFIIGDRDKRHRYFMLAGRTTRGVPPVWS